MILRRRQSLASKNDGRGFPLTPVGQPANDAPSTPETGVLVHEACVGWHFINEQLIPTTPCRESQSGYRE